ncbi:MAG: hypothetical protein FJ284_14410 [Planctomycetes bacterium]|nr:hypothetical protein [Planctomycetota bacterium]
MTGLYLALGLMLPTYPQLTDDDVRHVCHAIGEIGAAALRRRRAAAARRVAADESAGPRRRRAA